MLRRRILVAVHCCQIVVVLAFLKYYYYSHSPEYSPSSFLFENRTKSSVHHSSSSTILSVQEHTKITRGTSPSTVQRIVDTTSISLTTSQTNLYVTLSTHQWTSQTLKTRRSSIFKTRLDGNRNILTTKTPRATSKSRKVVSVHCPSSEQLESFSSALRSKIERNCRLYPQPKRVDWSVFTQNRSQYNHTVNWNDVNIWWSNFAVNRMFNTTYTIIFKSGSQEVITYLAKNSKFPGKRKIRNAHNYLFNGDFRPTFYMLGIVNSTEEAKKVMEHNFKFVFYRDPLQRLYSGFVDKVVGSIPRNYLPWLKKFYNFVKEKRQPIPTFKLFLEYLDTLNDSSTFDHHFRPQFLLSHPCEIQYDYMSLTDSISCSMPYILKKLNTSNHISLLKPKGSIHDLKNVTDGIEDLILRVMKKHFQVDYDILGFHLKL